MNKADMTVEGRRAGALPSRRCSTLVAALSAVFLFADQTNAGAEAVVPEGARVMTAVELYMLYRNKSWRWPDGAGRMEADGRVFKAWSGSGDDAVWARGRWIVTDTGTLCLKANWHGKAGSVEDRTCFSHMTDGRTIFQKKETSDEWYVFRHAEPQEGDEYKKLVREDLVTTRLSVHRDPVTQVNHQTLVLNPSLIGEGEGELR